MAVIEEDLLRSRSSGAEFLPVGDGLIRRNAASDSEFPSVNHNRVIGLGTSGEWDDAWVDQAHAAYTEQGIGLYFHYISPSAHMRRYRELLEGRGFQTRIHLAVLLGESKPSASDPQFEIRPLGDGDFSGDPVVDRNITDALAYAGDTGVVMGAFRGGQLLGTGMVKPYGDLAYLAHGVTAESHRNQGVQTALIHARKAWAHEQRIQWVCSETYEFLSSSYANLRRCGLEESYARAIYFPTVK